MPDNWNESRRGTVSEDELRENFDRYRELVDELSRRFPLPENGGSEPIGSEGDYVLEPIFVYQVHARSSKRAQRL